jgi:Tol biopolymer transport system component
VDGKSIGNPSLSSDGTRVLYSRFEKAGERFAELYDIVSIDGDVIQSGLHLPPAALAPAWTPDGRALCYIDRGQGWNVVRRPLPDGPAELLTHFTDGQVAGFRWSADGSWLALNRKVGRQDSLWMLKAGESRPTLVTEFKTGRSRPGLWAPDAPIFYFAYGSSTRDVVLISGIK